MLVTVENKHAKHTCSQRAPKVVVVIIGLHWIAFLYGVLFQLSVAELSSPIFISPSNSELWFRGTGVSTLRMHPVVTILTHQACHAGYSHIINNHILLISTGGFVELALGPASVLTIYAAGITGGAIFHSFVWQSNPLIGCSHGVYALCGGTLTTLALKHTEYDIENSLTAVVGLVLYLAFDIYYFIRSPIKNCAYEAHFSGFMIGVLVCGLLQHLPSWPSKKRKGGEGDEENNKKVCVEGGDEWVTIFGWPALTFFLASLLFDFNSGLILFLTSILTLPHVCEVGGAGEKSERGQNRSRKRGRPERKKSKQAYTSLS